MDDFTDDLRIRPGALTDAPAVLDMLDGGVAGMNARGNTEQWGTIPYTHPPLPVRRHLAGTGTGPAGPLTRRAEA
ncbi:hypothetical protein GCM10027075_37750 [Streptomyces heilongjiangensis]